MQRTSRLILFKQQKYLILLSIPGFLLFLIFNYVPMTGILIAFENYHPSKGIFGSDWVGFKHFITFFKDPFAVRTIRNTLIIGIQSILLFPAPIALALLLNEVHNTRFKKISQTLFNMPHFVSTVIVVGMMKDLFSVNDGAINDIVKLFGGQPINFFGMPQYFRTLYHISGLWAGLGWGTIIYLAALSGIDIEQYEAAFIDGASRFAQLRYITLPGLMPTISIMFILSIGSILGSDTNKILLMYSSATYETSDVIGTYVYRKGIASSQYSYSTAVGLFTSVLSFGVVAITNFVMGKMTESSLW